MKKKQMLFLFAFTSVAILLAVLAAMKGYASIETVSLTIVVAFASVAGLLFWWNRKHKVEVRTEGPHKASRSLIWLLAPFTASAIVALIQAMHEKWNVGDTIGLGFFLLFASVLVQTLVERVNRV